MQVHCQCRPPAKHGTLLSILILLEVGQPVCHLDPSQVSWVVMAQGLQHMFCGERIGAEAVQDGDLKATLAAELWVDV